MTLTDSATHEDERRVKVAFVLDGGPLTIPGTVRGEPPGVVETMWAEVLCENRYRLDNSPFDAYGISFRDVVTVELINGQLTATSIVLRGGHSTYRLILDKRTTWDRFLERWSEIAELGCSFEGADRTLVAVDVEPQANIHAVFNALQRGEDDGAWIFEEGHCGHAV